MFAAEIVQPMPNFGPLKVKLQLFCDAETAFGPGKADILEAIDRSGSISGAGREMGMSYRRTWLLVDTMNRCWSEPLVEALPGARKGRATNRQWSEGARRVSRPRSQSNGGRAEPGNADAFRIAARAPADVPARTELVELPRLPACGQAQESQFTAYIQHQLQW